MSEEDKLRAYVVRKLAAGTSPAELIAELVRYHVPGPRAQALVQEVAGMPWEGRPAPPPLPKAAGLGERMGRDDLVEFATGQLSYHDATTVHQQLLGQGCSEEEAQAILAAAGVAAGGEVVRTEPRAKSGGIESTYIRIPVGPENAKGWLSGDQRKVLGREFWRCVWILLVLLALGGVGVFLSGGVIGQLLSGRIVFTLLNPAGVFWLAVGVGLPALAVIGTVVLVVDMARHVADLFPGRIRIVRTYLRSPFVTRTGREVSCRVHIGRRQFRIWQSKLYDLIGQWGLQRHYQVYYSPLTRWIWHVEPGKD